MFKAQIRLKTAYLCFHLSSLFKFLGKVIITKEKGIMADALSLPGWFIIDGCMIHHVQDQDTKLIGFTWYTYAMPDEFLIELDLLKRQAGRIV